jgi:hypothetical protein
MADDEMSLELEDGAVAAPVVNGPSAADVEFEAQLDDAVQVLRHRGQTSLSVLALILVRLRLRTAVWFLGDQVRRIMEVEGDPALFDEFRHSIRRHILNFQQIGYLDHVVSGYLPLLVLRAAQQHAARLVLAYDNGGFGAVPASAAAAVRSLEKQTFHAAGGSDDDGVTKCSICFEQFVDGVQVSVMPCQCRGHRFHPGCIAKWLGISNVCPLCRHELPASTSV